MRLSILFISKYFYVEKLQPYLHIYIPTYIQDTIYMIPTKYINVDPRHKSKNVKKNKTSQHKTTQINISQNNIKQYNIKYIKKNRQKYDNSKEKI